VSGDRLEELRTLTRNLIQSMEITVDDLIFAGSHPHCFEHNLFTAIRTLKSIAENSMPVEEPHKVYLKQKLDLLTTSIAIMTVLVSV